MTTQRPIALITGASSGIGLEFAKLCAHDGFDLLLAADTPLDQGVSAAVAEGVEVNALQLDLSEPSQVDELVAAAAGRRIDILIANAGHGLGKGFLDQDINDAQHVVDTNVSGTIRLIHAIGNQMRAAGSGRILITGSIAGFIPGTFAAVYNGTKAFVDSFAWALRNELKDTGVSVTCLMPGVTDTNFFARADLMDTAVGTSDSKMDPAEVARIGYEAMNAGEGDVVAGLKNKVQVALANITPSAMLAEQHRKQAQPGSAK